MVVASGILRTAVAPVPGPAALFGYHEDDSTSPSTIVKSTYSDIGAYVADVGSKQIDTDIRFGGTVIRDGSDWSDGSMAWLNNKGTSGLFELHVVDFENNVERIINVETDHKPSGGTYSSTHPMWLDSLGSILWIECLDDPGVDVLFRLMHTQLSSGQTLGAAALVSSNAPLISAQWPGSQPATIPDQFRGSLWVLTTGGGITFYWRGEENWNGVPFIFKHSYRGTFPLTATRVSSSNDWGVRWPAATGDALAAQGLTEGGESYMATGGTSESALQTFSSVEGPAVDGWPVSGTFKLDANNDAGSGAENVQTLESFDSDSVLAYLIRYKAPPLKHAGARVIWADPAKTSGIPDTVIPIGERSGQESAKLPTHMTWR